MSETAAPAKSYASLRQKIPAFARFEGTSAWKKTPRRAREYARFLAAQRAAAKAPAQD